MVPGLGSYHYGHLNSSLLCLWKFANKSYTSTANRLTDYWSCDRKVELSASDCIETKQHIHSHSVLAVSIGITWQRGYSPESAPAHANHRRHHLPTNQPFVTLTSSATAHPLLSVHGLPVFPAPAHPTETCKNRSTRRPFVFLPYPLQSISVHFNTTK